MVTITPEAGEQLKGVLSQQGGPNAGLRLFVQSTCGCGNVGYGMGVDEAGATDSVFESDGVRVIVDPASATLLNDYDLCKSRVSNENSCKYGWGSFHPNIIMFAYGDGSVRPLISGPRRCSRNRHCAPAAVRARLA